MSDRAWAARGLTSPSPWGASVPPLWADTEVIFTRAGDEAVPDGIGGFARGDVYTVLIADGHVELRTETGLTTEGVQGLVLRYFYLAVLPVPEDPDELPRHLDRMIFTDELGVARDLEVAQVEAPEGDHLEVTSKEWT